MRQRRNKYLALSLVLLLLVCGGLFLFTNDESKPDINRELFKLADTEKIDQVTLQRNGQTIKLKFENSRWQVNDRWDADNRMIKVLFATLKQVEPKRPVASSMKDSVRSILEQGGTRVSLFAEGKAKSEFLAAGNSLKTETWFLKEGDSQAYSVTIPGYRVYVAGILELDESGWRNKRVFDFNWRNFKSLTSTYPKDVNESFEIEMKQGYFGIKNMNAVDTTKLNNYLDAVSLLFATRFVSAKSLDSLTSSKTIIKIEIKDIANRSYILELFTPGRKDTEVYGRLGDGQLVSIEKNALAEIVRPKDYFQTVQGR